MPKFHNNNQYFVGRGEFLGQFENAWNDYQLMGIFGLKSIGKSSTARQLIYRNHEKTSHSSLIIIDHIPGIKPMNQLYKRILGELQLFESFKTNSNETEESLILEHVQKMSGELIILIDDCENFISGVEYQSFIAFCQRLIQSSERIHVIITSCVSMPENDIHTGLFRELTPMTDEESYTFLYRLAPNANTADLKKIAALCGGFPLALQMIGAQFDDYSVEEIIALLTGSRIWYLSDEFFTLEERIDYVYAGLIHKLSPLFQERLASLNYIPASFQFGQAEGMINDLRDGGTRATINEDPPEQEVDKAIAFLRYNHILSFDQSSCRFNIHGILRDCIQISEIIFDKQRIRERYCKVFAAVLKSISSRIDTVEYAQALEQLSHEYPNLQKLLGDVEYSTSDTYHIFVDLVSTSSQLLHDYMGEDSVSFYMKCLEVTPQFGVAKDEAILRHGYGKMLSFERGQFNEAQKNYRLSLALLEDEQFCPLHVSIYTDLGFVLGHLSQRSDSLQVLELSMSIADKLGMQDENPILLSLMNLGTAYSPENSQKGERYLKDALHRCIEKFGSEENTMASNCLNRLGLLKQTNHENDSALSFFSQALKIRQKTKAGLHSMVVSLNNVAMQLSRLGNNKEAMRMLLEAEVLLKRTPGFHGYCHLVTFENFARLYQRLRQYDNAILACSEVLKIRDVESPNNMNVMEMLEIQALCYVAQQRFVESIPVWERTLSLMPVVQTSMPGDQLPIHCYQGYMEVLARQGNVDRLMTIKQEATKELDRLIQVSKRNNRLDLIKKLKLRFSATTEKITGKA